MDISRKLKDIRLGRLQSQEEFARELGVSYATVNRWETGRTQPNIKDMKKIDAYCRREGIDFDIRECIGTPKKDD